MDALVAALPYLLSPLVCAGIGWFTNFIAIKMLFHPRIPIRFGPLALQGIFPKRQKALAENLGAMIERELINHDDLQRVIQDPEFLAHFRGLIEEHIHTIVDQKLGELNPMVKMFLNDPMKEKIRALLRVELDTIIPDVMAQAAAEIERRLSFRDLVRQKVEAFSMAQLEEILFAIMKKEFRFIELVGGVLGFLIGALQAGLLYALQG